MDTAIMDLGTRVANTHDPMLDAALLATCLLAANLKTHLWRGVAA